MALTKVSRGLLSTSIVDNGNATAITIDSSENIGIGTGSPAYKLDVASAVIQFGDSTDAFAQYKSSAGNWHVGANSSNAFAFYSGTYGSGTERMRVDTNGHLILKNNLVLESTSEGIDFSGVGASAQTLDDYEEGTFTLTISSANFTIASQTNTYTKIGNTVSIRGRIVFSAVSSNSSFVVFTGAPFACTASIHGVGVARETTTSGDIFTAQLSESSTTFSFTSMDGVVAGSNQVLLANKNYDYQVTYQV